MAQQRFPPLNRDFFQNNPKIDQKERLPYPEYRYTKYFWLINLNQACYTREQAEYLVKLLRKAVLDVFTRGDVVAFAHPNHKWDRRYIGNNELQLAIEVGPKKGRVHAHLIQEIKHRSVINIDPQDVKIRINTLLASWTGGRVTNAFVTRKIHPSSKPLEEYIDKDNTPWRNNPQTVNGLFAYTLVYDGERPGWEAYDTTPRPIPISASEEYLNRFPGDVPLRGEGRMGPESSTGSEFGFPGRPRPTTKPKAASSSYDYDPVLGKPAVSRGGQEPKQRLLSPAERALLKRSKRA